MPRLSPAKLDRALEDGRRGGVFFLHGDEAYLRDSAEDRLIEAHVDPSTRDFNLDRLHGPDTDAEALASLFQTPPMMAEWRVVVVRQAQALASSPNARRVVEELLDSPPPGLAVIISAEIPPRSRAKFYKTLKKEATAVEFPRLDASDLPGYLVEDARADGFTLEPEAGRAMVSAIGTDLGVLRRELDKLREFVGENGRADRSAVESAVGKIETQDRWEWFDMVGERRFGEARAALPVLLDAGESGVGLVIGLGTHILRLGLAHAGGRAALQGELPRHQQWLARRLVPQARAGWDAATVQGALDDLLQADRLLKSASLTDLQIMDGLLLRMRARAEKVAA